MKLLLKYYDDGFFHLKSTSAVNCCFKLTMKMIASNKSFKSKSLIFRKFLVRWSFVGRATANLVIEKQDVLWLTRRCAHSYIKLNSETEPLKLLISRIKPFP